MANNGVSMQAEDRAQGRMPYNLCKSRRSSGLTTSYHVDGEVLVHSLLKETPGRDDGSVYGYVLHTFVEQKSHALSHISAWRDPCGDVSILVIACVIYINLWPRTNLACRRKQRHTVGNYSNRNRWPMADGTRQYQHDISPLTIWRLFILIHKRFQIKCTQQSTNDHIMCPTVPAFPHATTRAQWIHPLAVEPRGVGKS
ncbi:hypothetical protein BGW80DRAFT_930033 [Lactifluus volemus]|nr:hypothetical protein BGW80DRAFT_930033 [Lactifluus volemus]